MKKVNVLLSVYNPNIDFLKEQLISISKQSYKNLEVIIFDDCVEHRCDIEIFEKYLSPIKYKILPYKNKNLGYVKAFELLVENADGEYIALCDQDDVWELDKIEKCVECLDKDGTVLVATDRSLIDENGHVFCKSVRHSKNAICEKWSTYDDIGIENFFQSGAPGMCMLMKTDFAKSTIPFSTYTGHDKWLLACANVCGGVSFLDEPLSKYRRYGKNVSGVLVGVDTVADYEKNRILPHLNLIREFDERYPGYAGIDIAYKISSARLNHKIFELIRYRRYIPTLFKFEIVISILPHWMTKKLIKIMHGIK